MVCVIPARGGSKGLPGKNTRLLAGKPLIAYSIEAAVDAKRVDRVLVSTDHPVIAQVAQDHGAEVPFLRPAELAQDDTPTEPVLAHALRYLRDVEGYQTDILVFLQPTDIFRRAGMIDWCVSRLQEDPDLETAFVAYKTHKNFWHQTAAGYERLITLPYGPRQSRKPIFREDTGIACATRSSLIFDNERVGSNVDILVTDDEATGIDIHSEFDFWLAETVIRERNWPVNR